MEGKKEGVAMRAEEWSLCVRAYPLVTGGSVSSRENSHMYSIPLFFHFTAVVEEGVDVQDLSAQASDIH